MWTKRPPRLERIIPARAGFTRAATGPPWPTGDHPRSRGVYVFTPKGSSQTVGSSPLARGLLQGVVDEGGDGRIIPARAGFTSTPWTRTGSTRDHPRSRGVYVEPSIRRTVVPGSSPLARGLPPVGGANPHDCRIIPARAGFTRQQRDETAHDWDHPRSRGVYRLELGERGEVAGSSPLARGLLVDLLARQLTRRIIPARAGFTLKGWINHGSTRDHPRSRGVYTRDPVYTPMGVGSSPLARGLPELGPRRRKRRRIIPARAGFTRAGR